MNWRIIAVISFFGILYSFLLFTIFNIQIEKHKEYLVLAGNQNIVDGLLPARRGVIYFTDKSGNKTPAVLNKEYPELFAVPLEIQKSFVASPDELAAAITDTANTLSSIIGIPASEIDAKLHKKNDQYELLAEKLTGDMVREIKTRNLTGIYIKDTTSRFYPFKTIASHILGFVSPANETESKKVGNALLGRYGVELYFNAELSGLPGRVEGDHITESKSGSDIVLTIDPTIQGEAEEILEKLVEAYKAKGGSVIVAEPKTGKILAMGSSPDFDPNTYSKFAIGTFLNPAVEAVYEPGSIAKVLTMAAGIDAKKITPETKYYDTGTFTANGKTISNWDLKAVGPHGWQTMADVIDDSINTGAVFAQRQMGSTIFSNYFRAFGLGTATNITLPGEVNGNLHNLQNGKDIDYATASYGQGISVTPLALIGAISAIANGGTLMKPYIIASEKPQIVDRVMSEVTAKKVKDMMVSAVFKNKLAVIPGYTIAAKTGTAFVPNFGGKGYTNDVINSYIGFGPASDPKFIILLKLDKPEGSPLAGQTVVPAFHELAQYIINYLNIPPDNLNPKS
mgnify:CR=1 FL=1